MSFTIMPIDGSINSNQLLANQDQNQVIEVGIKKTNSSSNLKQKLIDRYTCSICLDLCNDIQIITIDDCFHKFCRECIEDALQSKPLCPLCRRSFTKTDLKHDRDIQETIDDLREQNAVEVDLGKEESNVATSYGNIGNVYQNSLGADEKALEYQLKALKIQGQIIPPQMKVEINNVNSNNVINSNNVTFPLSEIGWQNAIKISSASKALQAAQNYPAVTQHKYGNYHCVGFPYTDGATIPFQNNFNNLPVHCFTQNQNSNQQHIRIENQAINQNTSTKIPETANSTDVVRNKVFSGVGSLHGNHYVNCTFSGSYSLTYPNVLLENCNISGVVTCENGGRDKNCIVSGFCNGLQNMSTDVVRNKIFQSTGSLHGNHYVNCTFSGSYSLTYPNVLLENCNISGMVTCENGGRNKNSIVTGFCIGLK